jgi:hypothetical protein
MKNKRLGGMTEVVEYMPSIRKALGSIPSTTKINKVTRLKTTTMEHAHLRVTGWEKK